MYNSVTTIYLTTKNVNENKSVKLMRVQTAEKSLRIICPNNVMDGIEFSVVITLKFWFAGYL